MELKFYHKTDTDDPIAVKITTFLDVQMLAFVSQIEISRLHVKDREDVMGIYKQRNERALRKKIFQPIIDDVRKLLEMVRSRPRPDDPDFWEIYERLKAVTNGDRPRRVEAPSPPPKAEPPLTGDEFEGRKAAKLWNDLNRHG